MNNYLLLEPKNSFPSLMASRIIKDITKCQIDTIFSDMAVENLGDSTEVITTNEFIAPYVLNLSNNNLVNNIINKKVIEDVCILHNIPTVKSMDINKIDNWNNKVIKPVSGGGGFGVNFINSEKEFIDIEKKYKNFLIQEKINLKQIYTIFRILDGHVTLLFHCQKTENGFELNSDYHEYLESCQKYITKLANILGIKNGFLSPEFFLGDYPFLFDLNPRLPGWIILSMMAAGNYSIDEPFSKCHRIILKKHTLEEIVSHNLWNKSNYSGIFSTDKFSINKHLTPGITYELFTNN